jgi:UDP-N-acetylmuramoylalanine--D-glutamate ligase
MRMELKDKKVTVIGLARSGVGAANVLAEMGALVTVTDQKPETALAAQIGKLVPSVKLALGGHPDDVFMSADMLVISPGVPPGTGRIADAKAKGVPVIGELELAYRVIRQSSLNDELSAFKDGLPFIAITGSNGKSTTTTLLDVMLREGGSNTLLGGNIGNALTEEIFGTMKTEISKRKKYDFIVAEVSSFQLEAVDTFRPHIAAILNITPDHMDRYHFLSEYSEAKARVFANQGKDDFLIINSDDPETVGLVEDRFRDKADKPELYFFSRSRQVRGVYHKESRIWCDMPHRSDIKGPVPLISSEEIGIKGVHNLENAMAASAMALLAGCPVGAVIDALRNFSGLEHRLEFVRELDGVRYINDSKGTNVGAVEKSIQSFDAPLILIAGGRDKAGDFASLGRLVAEKVKTLVLIGEAAEKIKDALGDVTETVIAASLNEAVEVARDKAEKGNVVLLSPACASFDMFIDFEDRGRQFKDIVRGLKGK